jgi:hypothetical protein
MFTGVPRGFRPPTTDSTTDSTAGVLRECCGCASGVHLVCIWGASGVHLVCIWCASGVHLVCIWCASGVTNDFFLFFIATFYRVKTLLTMLRIRDPDLGVIQRQEIAAHKHQTHTHTDFYGF